jgi:hypothetical protein
MPDKELMQMALDALIDAADSQNWEMQQNIDQHGEWYRRSLYLKQATTNSQAAIEALRIRLSQCERCGEKNPAEIHTCTPMGVSLTSMEHPILGKAPKYKLSKDSLEPVMLVEEWQGLTDEERNACLVEADPCEALLEHEAWQLMRDIEAKLKEKNT